MGTAESETVEGPTANGMAFGLTEKRYVELQIQESITKKTKKIHRGHSREGHCLDSGEMLLDEGEGC